MIFLYIFVALVVGFFLGVVFVSMDKDIHRMKSDEVIVKKPDDGLILVAVTPDVARRLVMRSTTSEG